MKSAVPMKRKLVRNSESSSSGHFLSAPGKRESIESEEESESMPLNEDVEVEESTPQLRRSISDVVRLFIFKHSRGELVSFSEISKCRLASDKTLTNKALLDEADAVLKEVFGLKISPLVKFDKEGHILPRKSSTVVSTDLFFLESLLSNAEDLCHLSDIDQTDANVRGLVMAIYALIYLKGNRIGEEELRDSLAMMGVNMDQLDHPVFGHIEKFISKSLVQQKYLLRFKIILNDQQTEFRFEYAIGPRGIHLLEDNSLEAWIDKLMNP